MRTVSVGMRASALVGLVALAGGCFWTAPGATAERDGYNALESAISPDTVGGLALAWEATTDGGPVLDPVTSAAGVHVLDRNHAYGVDRTGERLWSVASPEPLRNHEAYVTGTDTVLVGRWDPTATQDTNPSGGDETLRLDAATGEPVAEPATGVVIGARGDRVLRWTVEHVRLGRFGQYRFWRTELGLDGTSCCAGWLGLADGTVPATPPDPAEFTVGSTQLFQAGDGLLSSTDPAVPMGNGLRGYSIDAPVVCLGNYVCPSWVVPLDGTTATRPALARGGEVAYVGTDAGTVHAVDGAGQPLWTTPVGAAVVDTPAVAGGSVYVPTSDQGVVVLDAATGARRWSAAAGAAVVAQPAVAGGVVFVAAGGGTVAAYDAGGCGAPTCPALWTAATGAEVTGGPAVDRGALYVGTADARLLAYDLA